MIEMAAGSEPQGIDIAPRHPEPIARGLSERMVTPASEGPTAEIDVMSVRWLGFLCRKSGSNRRMVTVVSKTSKYYSCSVKKYFGTVLRNFGSNTNGGFPASRFRSRPFSPFS